MYTNQYTIYRLTLVKVDRAIKQDVD